MMHASVGKKHKLDGDLPMKARRRQSDAKWRANVASCYETLKHIIPVNKRASKRQISKAVILQETSKHINFLENILRTLLQEKAEKSDIVGDDAERQWVEEEIDTIKNSFEEKLGERMDGMNEERRYKRNRYKRYISENLMKESVQSTASVRSVIFEQKAAEHQPKKRSNLSSTVAKTMKKKMRTTTRAPASAAAGGAAIQEVPEMSSDSTAACNDWGEFVLEDGPFKQKEDSFGVGMPAATAEVPEMKNDDIDCIQGVNPMFLLKNDVQFTTMRPCEMSYKDSQHSIPPAPPSSPVKGPRKRLLATPLKQDLKKEESDYSATPVKLPRDWTLCPLTPVHGSRTPGKTFRSPAQQSVCSDAESEAHGQNLLCQEDMWLSDDEQDQTLDRFERTPILENEHTSLRDVRCKPRRKRKRCDSLSSQMSDGQPCKKFRATDNGHEVEDNTPSCRRSLNLNMKQEPVWDDNEDHGQRDFDGYLLYYKKMVDEFEKNAPVEESDASRVIYNMWQQLPAQQKKNYREMAEVEREISTEESSNMAATNGLDFESSFYPLPEIDILTGEDYAVPEIPAVKPEENSGNKPLSPNPRDISEVDVKPILPLSPWRNYDEDANCSLTYSDVSSLFDTSIHSMLSHIKVEKQD